MSELIDRAIKAPAIYQHNCCLNDITAKYTCTYMLFSCCNYALFECGVESNKMECNQLINFSESRMLDKNGQKYFEDMIFKSNLCLVKISDEQCGALSLSVNTDYIKEMLDEKNIHTSKLSIKFVNLIDEQKEGNYLDDSPEGPVPSGNYLDE